MIRKIPSSICKNLTFSDCELVILRMAVDKAEKTAGKQVVASKDVQKIFQIVEEYIKNNNLICYGGTAVNNILPQTVQFYNHETDLPDYDVFSDDALSDAKRLADLFVKRGFTEVEARSGQHYGTYKVYANFIAVADITQMPLEIMKRLQNDAIHVEQIMYAPANFLRMSMYLELSRPAGDVSRWEKVQKRLALLNKYYPIADHINCTASTFQRKMEDPIKANERQIFELIKNSLVAQDVVFFGGFANTLYSKYMPKNRAKTVRQIADFDVLSLDPKQTIDEVAKLLRENDINVQVRHHDPLGELIPDHYELLVGNDTVLFVYATLGCHSYNIIKRNKLAIKVATIDTMLSFYLAFLYADRPYYDAFVERFICMSNFLFEVQQENRLSQRGLLKRFSITCYGKQITLMDIKAKKSEQFKKLKKHPNRNEHERWFLNYRPKLANSPRAVSPVLNKSPTSATHTHTYKNNINYKRNQSRRRNNFLGIFEKRKKYKGPYG